MAHWVKVFVVKADNLSLVPGSHVKGENRNDSTELYSGHHMYTYKHIINKCKEDTQKVGTFMTG